MDIDFNTAKQIGLAHIKEWLPNGKQRGSEWLHLNPRRTQDKHVGSFSVNLDTGVWGDFANGDGGADAVSLYAYINGIDKQGEAAKQILDKYGHSQQAQQAPQQTHHTASQKHTPIYPAPVDAGVPSMHHPIFGTPSMHWLYKDRTGATLFYVARYDTDGERKQYNPWSFTDHGWRAVTHPDPRPLFNLDLLAAYPDKKVLIVEGEKCARVGTDILTDYITTCWPNGTNSVGKVDFTPLRNRHVVIWRDNDDPGAKAAREVKTALNGIATDTEIIKIPEGKPKGWDIADAVQVDGMNEHQLLLIIEASHMKELEDQSKNTLPYRPVGFERNTYYFLSSVTHEVLPVSNTNLSKKSMLFSLAPIDYWETTYATKKGLNVDQISNDLIQQCKYVGPYNPYKLRGRGAWYDAGRVVLHLGDRLVVDDKQVELDTIITKHIYETRPSIGNANAEPLSSKDGERLINLMSGLTFTRGASHHFLAGWCMIATICGALEWRPHIWVTGPAGSGKSWVMEHIVIPLLGDSKIYALGKSSEAGIRQMLNNDALPVVIDEAESDEKNQKDAIQAILTLMRQASSDTGAVIYRGSVSGKASGYGVRSCFMLSSIGVATKHHADETRVTVLNLAPDRSDEARGRFDILSASVGNLITPDFCEQIRSRAIRMIPIIRQNKNVLARFIRTKVISSQRMADQYGALLAGEYALSHDDVITYEQAEVWATPILQAREDDSEVLEVSDHTRCLQDIITYRLTIRPSASYGTIDTSIGELVAIMCGKVDHDLIKMKDADKYLKNSGIRYFHSTQMVHVADRHPEVSKMLRDTPYANNYSSMLRRLDGADYDKNKTTYGSGVFVRGTRIPLWMIFQDDPFAGVLPGAEIADM